MDMRSTRIFVVDDEPDVTDLLGQMLDALGFGERACTNDATAAWQELVAFGPDVAIVDIVLGSNLCGLDLCRHIRANPELSGIGILVLSGCVARGAAEAEIFVAGADNFMRKAELTPVVLQAKIQAILRRRQPTRGICVGPLRIVGLGRRVELEGVPVPLSTTELSIISVFASRPFEVIPPHELLRGKRAGHLLKWHVHNIRQKFGAHAGLLQTVRGSGYRLVGKPQAAHGGEPGLALEPRPLPAPPRERRRPG